MSITVSLELREIYRLLCDECRKKLRQLVQRKISEKLTDQAIGLDSGGEG
jgi:hypothetical protein